MSDELPTPHEEAGCLLFLIIKMLNFFFGLHDNRKCSDWQMRLRRPPTSKEEKGRPLTHQPQVVWRRDLGLQAPSPLAQRKHVLNIPTLLS